MYVAYFLDGVKQGDYWWIPRPDSHLIVRSVENPTPYLRGVEPVPQFIAQEHVYHLDPPIEGRICYYTTRSIDYTDSEISKVLDQFR